MAAVEKFESASSRVLLSLLSFFLTTAGLASSAPDMKTLEPATAVKSLCGSTCLAQGLLHHSDGQCYAPLQRGPCPQGNWLRLAARNSQGSVEGLCEPRPCPSHLLPLGGRCLREDDVRAEFCTGGHVHLDATGVPLCGEFPGWTRLLQADVGCSPPAGSGVHPAAAVVGSGVECAHDDSNQCSKVVKVTVPKLTFISEDE